MIKSPKNIQQQDNNSHRVNFHLKPEYIPNSPHNSNTYNNNNSNSQQQNQNSGTINSGKKKFKEDFTSLVINKKRQTKEDIILTSHSDQDLQTTARLMKKSQIKNLFKIHTPETLVSNLQVFCIPQDIYQKSKKDLIIQQQQQQKSHKKHKSLQSISQNQTQNKFFNKNNNNINDSLNTSMYSNQFSNSMFQSQSTLASATSIQQSANGTTGSRHNLQQLLNKQYKSQQQQNNSNKVNFIKTQHSFNRKVYQTSHFASANTSLLYQKQQKQQLQQQNQQKNSEIHSPLSSYNNTEQNFYKYQQDPQYFHKKQQQILNHQKQQKNHFLNQNQDQTFSSFKQIYEHEWEKFNELDIQRKKALHNNNNPNQSPKNALNFKLQQQQFKKQNSQQDLGSPLKPSHQKLAFPTEPSKQELMQLDQKRKFQKLQRQTTFAEMQDTMNNKLKFNNNQNNYYQHYLENHKNSIQSQTQLDILLNEQKIQKCLSKVRIKHQEQLNQLQTGTPKAQQQDQNQEENDTDFTSLNDKNNQQQQQQTPHSTSTPSNNKNNNVVKFNLQKSQSQKDKNKEKDMLVKIKLASRNQPIVKVQFFWTQLKNINDWKAESRESACMIQMGQKLIVYGGVGQDVFEDVCFFDVLTFEWKKKPFPDSINKKKLFNTTNMILKSLQKKQENMNGRFGMTVDFYKGKLVFLGGQKEYNSHLNVRQCYNDIRIYDPQYNKWTTHHPAKYGCPIIARRNHCSQLIADRFLFYFGGIDSSGNYLNDLSCYDLETQKNIQTQFTHQKRQNPGLACAKMCAVFKGDIQLEHYYNPYDYKKDKNKLPLKKLKEEGLYIFGGKNSKGNATNHLKCVKIGQQPLVMTPLTPSGTPPRPRYGHTMDYFLHLNALIIYGGMNDQLQSQFYLNDIFLLDLETLNWIEVEQLGPKIPGKSMHCSQVIDTKLYIFGGIQQQGLCNSDVYILEMDPQNVTKLSHQEKFRKVSYKTPDEIKGYLSEAYQPHIDIKQRSIMNLQATQEELPEEYMKQLDNFGQEQCYQQQVYSFQPVNPRSEKIVKDIKSYLGYSDYYKSIVLKEPQLMNQNNLNPIQKKANMNMVNSFIKKMQSQLNVGVISAQELDKYQLRKAYKHEKEREKNNNQINKNS